VSASALDSSLLSVVSTLQPILTTFTSLTMDVESVCSVETTESKDESKADADTDWKPATNSKSSKKSKSKKSRKRKQPDTVTVDDDHDDKPPTKRRKKRGWSDEEESLFRGGLAEFGRDWKAVAAHIGHDRNAASVRSHAQVYFLKLLAERQPLPDKVRESGSGYTLGGGPLNKYSSIAVRQFGSADNVPMIEGVVSDEEGATKKKRKSKEPKEAKNATSSAGSKANSKGKAKGSKAKKSKKKRKKYYDSSDDEDELYELSNMTMSAPSGSTRRSGRARRCVRGQIGLHETDPFGLRTDIELYAPFEGKAEATSKRSKWSGSCSVPQPFGIEYCPNALLLADIHCHLCLKVEVMGLLGGDYDADRGVMFIRKCVPLREEEQGEQSVAADASHHLEVIEAMKEEGIQPLGWYHSHPCFENVPSNTDCHQHFIHKFPDETVNPYVGLIVSSWSTEDLVSGVSHFRFFNSVMESATSYMPFECHSETKVGRALDDEELLVQIADLIERYSASKYDIYRSDLGEDWSGTKLSRLEKVLQSVRGHLQNGKAAEDETEDDDLAEEEEQFVHRIRNLFVQRASTWFVTNRPSKEEVDAAVKAEESRSETADSVKENENSMNVQ